MNILVECLSNIVVEVTIYIEIQFKNDLTMNVLGVLYKARDVYFIHAT